MPLKVFPPLYQAFSYPKWSKDATDNQKYLSGRILGPFRITLSAKNDACRKCDFVPEIRHVVVSVHVPVTFAGSADGLRVFVRWSIPGDLSLNPLYIAFGPIILNKYEKLFYINPCNFNSWAYLSRTASCPKIPYGCASPICSLVTSMVSSSLII